MAQQTLLNPFLKLPQNVGEAEKVQDRLQWMKMMIELSQNAAEAYINQSLSLSCEHEPEDLATY